MSRRLGNPWDELRRRSSDDPSDPTRPRERRTEPAGDFLPPGGSERLWSATAGVLSSLRALIEVAEDLCEEKGRGSGMTRPTEARPSPPPADGFRRVAFVDDEAEEAIE